MGPKIRPSFAVVLATIAGVLLYSPASYCSDSSTLDEAKLDRSLKTLGRKEPSIRVPPEIEKSKDRKVRDEYFAKRKLQFVAFEREIDEAVTALANMGDPVIKPLISKLLKGGPDIDRAALEVRVPRVLAQLGTPQAKEILLEMALGSRRFGAPDSVALHQYLQIAKDAQEARSLLVSNDPKVFLETLRRFPTIPIDDELLSRLRPLLVAAEYHPMENFAMRQHAALVIAKDNGTVPPGQKVAAIVDSLRTVDDMPTANDKFGPDVGGTLADLMYYTLIVNAMSKMEGATPSLRDAKDGLNGSPRAAVVIALALRGESAVKQELRDVLRDPLMVSMTNMRGQAARALGVVGTKDDMPFLEQLIRDDPLEIVDFHGPIFEMVNGQYVNTGPRMAPIVPESDPAWKTARRWYPIREAATQAIQAIEQRVGLEPSQSPPQK